jgi:hypothetical protein
VGETTEALVVNYTVTGTATSADYQESLTGTVEIPVGVSYVNLVVTPKDDRLVEGPETVIITLLDSANYVVGVRTVTITIQDNDTVSMPLVSIVATDPNASEDGQDPGTFTVSRDGDTTTALVVYYTVGGTASIGDYSPVLTNSVEIPAGAVSVPIQITPSDDEDDEPNETLILTLTEDPGYAIVAPSATVTIVDNEVPQVTAVTLNQRAGRTVSMIEPSGIGVQTIAITFDEAVVFDASDLEVRKVTFNGESEVPGTVLSPTLSGSGTTVMTLTFAKGSVVDTWVKVTLKGTGGVTDTDGRSMDGEAKPTGTGRGYVYSTADLPTGDGVAGGDAVFFVGNLRGDMRGEGFSGFAPDGKVNVWDVNGFTSRYTTGNMDADMRGAGFTGLLPDGVVDVWDINGFTSFYQAAVRDGTHLDPLPTAAPLAAGSPAPLSMAATLAPHAKVQEFVPADVPLVLAAPATTVGVAAASAAIPGIETSMLIRIEPQADAGARPDAEPFAWEEGPSPDGFGALPHELDDDLVDVLDLVALGVPLGV